MTLKVGLEVGEPLHGQLLYRMNEYSFMYQASDDAEVQRRAGSEGVTSLVVDTLQLEVGVETGQLLFAWGYLPTDCWLESSFPKPEVVSAIVRLDEVRELDPGVSISISRGSEWSVEFDRNNGWLKVANPCVEADDIAQIADSVAVGVKEGQIVSIWLFPRFVD